MCRRFVHGLASILILTGVLVLLGAAAPWPADREIYVLSLNVLQKIVGDPTVGFPTPIPIMAGLGAGVVVAVGPDGLLYVSDPVEREIVRCDPDGQNRVTIMKKSDLPAFDLTFDSRGDLLFTTFGMDFRCTATLGVWKIPGAAAGAAPERVVTGDRIAECVKLPGWLLPAICAVTAGPHAGDFLVGGTDGVAIARVAGPAHHTITTLVREGRVSPLSNPDVEIELPFWFTDFCSYGSEGGILAADWVHGRILEFGPDGALLRVVADLENVYQLATDSSGNVYATTSLTKTGTRLVGFDASGRVIFQVPVNDLWSVAVRE